MKLDTKSLLAAFFSFAAFSLWVGTDSLNKLAADSLPLMQRCCLNQGFAGLVFLLLSFRGAGLAELKSRKPKLHIARGLVNCVNVVTLIYAVQHLPLANFYAIAFTSPFMIALISWGVLKEKIASTVWIAILAGFAGVLISINPQDYDPKAWGLIPVASMVVANLCYAFYALTVKTFGEGETVTALTFYPEAASTFVTGAIMLSRGEWVADPAGIACSVISGLLNGFAVFCIVEAYRRGKNSFVASFQYSQIAVGGLVGYLVWGDAPTVHLIIGVAIIIAAGAYILWHGVSKAEDPATEARPARAA